MNFVGFLNDNLSAYDGKVSCPFIVFGSRWSFCLVEIIIGRYENYEWNDDPKWEIMWAD